MPRLAPFTRTLSVLTLGALSLVGLGGCGDCCNNDNYVYGGTLRVVNDPLSLNGIDTVQASVPGGPVEPFDVFLAPGEDVFIDFYPDSYDVTLLWSDSTFDDFFGVDVFDHQTTTLVGTN